MNKRQWIRNLKLKFQIVINKSIAISQKSRFGLLKMRNQRSEIRSQISEVRNPRSEIKNQRSEIYLKIKIFIDKTNI